MCLNLDNIIAYDLVSFVYNPSGLDMVKQNVSAKSRRLGAQWTVEIEQDLVCGVSDEVVSAIAAEIDAEVLSGSQTIAQKLYSSTSPYLFDSPAKSHVVDPARGKTIVDGLTLKADSRVLDILSAGRKTHVGRKKC